MYIRQYVGYQTYEYDYTTYYRFGEMDYVLFDTIDGSRYFHFRVSFVELKTPPKLYIAFWIVAAVSILAFVEFEGVVKFLKYLHE